jgi:hypothetical protein
MPQTSDYDKVENKKYINNPIEIIDISIPKVNDDFIIDESLISKYKYKYEYFGNYVFSTYNIVGFIKDLSENLIVHNKYIWLDSKYEKRLNRLCFFILLHLIDENKLDKVQNICDYLQELSDLTKINYFI